MRLRRINNGQNYLFEISPSKCLILFIEEEELTTAAAELPLLVLHILLFLRLRRQSFL
jgi:hypothetical protein